MPALFEAVKLIFFFATIMLGLLLFRGEYIFPTNSIDQLHKILLPGYLVICGLLIGYIIYLFRTQGLPDYDHHRRVGVQSFIIGIMVGICFALVNTFTLS